MPERHLTVPTDDGLRLATRVFDDAGPDAPCLVLHHGLASSSRIWDLMLPRLASACRVAAFDARGHGRSSKPSGGYGFDRVAEDVRAVASAAGFRRPIVSGHSWGAMVTLELAAARPSWIAGAVAIDGGVEDLGMDWAAVKRALSPPALDGMPVERFRAQIPHWSPVPVTPQIEEVFLSLMRVDSAGLIHPRLSRANHLRILRKIWEQRPLELWARIEVPTLAILASGDDDDREARASARVKRSAAADARRAATGRDATFAWMRGAHDLPLQHPEALARRILRFVDRTVG